MEPTGYWDQLLSHQMYFSTFLCLRPKGNLMLKYSKNLENQWKHSQTQLSRALYSSNKINFLSNDLFIPCCLKYSPIIRIMRNSFSPKEQAKYIQPGAGSLTTLETLFPAFPCQIPGGQDSVSCDM